MDTVVCLAFLLATGGAAVLAWLARGHRDRHLHDHLELRLADLRDDRDRGFDGWQRTFNRLGRAERDLRDTRQERDRHALDAALLAQRLRTHRREAADGLEALAALDIDRQQCPAREWVDSPGGDA